MNLGNIWNLKFLWLEILQSNPYNFQATVAPTSQTKSIYFIKIRPEFTPLREMATRTQNREIYAKP